MSDEERIQADLLGFTWRDEDGAFSVTRFRTPEGVEFTAVGPLVHLVPGQTVLLTGTWQAHVQYGRQFRVTSFLVEDPRTLEGMRAYLASGAVRGVGPELARRLVDHFGVQTLKVLAETPERLREVFGVGQVLLERIQTAYRQDMERRELLAALRGYGVGAAVARRVLDRYGVDGLAVVHRDPYRLAREVPGVGFRTADSVARHLGFARDNPHRVEAAVAWSLSEAEDDGHCFLPEGALRERVVALDVPEGAFRDAVHRMLLDGRLRSEEVSDPALRPLQSPSLARTERFVAQGLVALASRLPLSTLIRAVDAERRVGLTLDPDQRRAVDQALRQGLVVVTGGPGTGKTTIVRVLLVALRLLGEVWKLCAPTGRAAKRLTESSGQEATTIHRLLEFSFPEGGFKRDAANPLDVDGVLVDEASMLDVRLMASLLAALPPRARLVLVGDDHQLPSVGPGEVLRDVIESGVAPVVRLREVYRQEEGSGIVVNAHRVDRGELPVSAEKEVVASEIRSNGQLPRRIAQDFFVLDRDDPLEIQALLLEIVTVRLPRRGFDPQRDVQVLVPVHRGELGTQVLNQRLQAALNPAPAPGPACQHPFRPGDRVIQVRNNYDLGVFNGEVGRILATWDESVVVDFDGREVGMVGEQLRELELAYAITVHKSQGSEYPAVILVLHKSHKVMLQRNLLYTGITRARSFGCVIGSRFALRMAVAVAGRGDRYTLLRDRLAEAAGSQAARDMGHR